MTINRGVDRGGSHQIKVCGFFVNNLVRSYWSKEVPGFSEIVVVNKSSVLIIEDDASLREALKVALEKKGHSVFASGSAEEAGQIMNEQVIQYLFVDCLLPGISGDEFVMKSKSSNNKDCKTYLMSGIYTDKSTIQDLLKKTQASAFLKKPFDLDQVLSLVKTDNVLLDSIQGNLYQGISKETVSNKEKRILIESLKEVSGYDLPYVYSLLSETKSSGYLNIYFENEVTAVTFANGCIINVDSEDKSTYIGELLIQSGYVTPSDILNALSSKNNQRLGQRLISANLMSPHALDLTVIEQMNFRLAKTVVDKKVKVNFSVAEVEHSQPHIDADLLLEYLHDWITSKISSNWVENFYTKWMAHLILPTMTFKKDHKIFSLNLVQSLEGLAEKLLNKPTLNSLIQNHHYNSKALYKVIHILFTKGLIYFSNDVEFVNEKEQLDFLNKLNSELENKNGFEVLKFLGLSEYTDKEKTINEIESFIGKKPDSTNARAFSLWNKLYAKVKTSILEMSPERRKHHQKNEEKNVSENNIKANQLVDEAKKDLLLNQFQSALTKLKDAGKLSTNIFQYNIYLVWARLGMAIPKKNKELIKEIEFELMQISPEERYDALYPYVMGLYYKAINDLLNAKKSFGKSLAMDTTFIAARRELSLLEMHFKNVRKQESIFSMDLKDVVTVLFRKK